MPVLVILVEDPFGYICAEYRFEKLTEIVTKEVVKEIKKKHIETTGL